MSSPSAAQNVPDVHSYICFLIHSTFIEHQQYTRSNIGYPQTAQPREARREHGTWYKKDFGGGQGEGTGARAVRNGVGLPAGMGI